LADEGLAAKDVGGVFLFSDCFVQEGLQRHAGQLRHPSERITAAVDDALKGEAKVGAEFSHGADTIAPCQARHEADRRLAGAKGDRRIKIHF
jgi:hypothetical protein